MTEPHEPAPPAGREPPALDDLRRRVDEAVEQVRRVVLGQQEPVRLMLCCLLARGHALLEGVPGTAKTLLARSLAATVGARFRRIQFTPDLMPSDVVGTHIFDPRTQDFRVRTGPVFTDLLLADEINRTPPKTQAALLEAMEERTVTLAGERRVVSPVFTVFATQNPLEFEGTYPLPEAQLDRFMMKIRVPYLEEQAELEVLRRYSGDRDGHASVQTEVSAVLDVEGLQALRRTVAGVHVEDGILRYVRGLLVGSRESEAVLLGLGTRAGLHLLAAARAWAVLAGRDFVTPDDIALLAQPVLAHRLVLHADAQVDGLTAEEVVAEILRTADVPR